MAFFDGDWCYIGNKESRAEAIETVTGIPGIALDNSCALREFDIYDRMSWASDRHATRAEDIAYSLMGIFDIHMPLLYGEGTRAFTRLQEEIIRRARETTFLLWCLDYETSTLLASSPADFQEVQGLEIFSMQTMTRFSLTNFGLEIQAQLFRYQLQTYGLVICHGQSTTYAVLLRRLPWLDAFYKVSTSEIGYRDITWFEERRITILRDSRDQSLGHEINVDEYIDGIAYGFRVQSDPTFPTSPAPSPPAQWATVNHFDILICSFATPVLPNAAKMICKLSISQTLWLELSFDLDSRPCLLLKEHEEGIKSYENLRDPTVWELSGCFKSSMSIVGHPKLWWSEVKLWEIVDETTGAVSHFLRDETREDICARLPPSFTPPNGPVWMYLSPPLSHRNSFNSWLLGISSTPPTDIGEEKNMAFIASNSLLRSQSD